MPITPLFAAIFGLFYVLLSLAVIKIRFGEKISRGHGDNPQLEKSIRIHGNFAEYVPITLLLLWFLETISLNSHLILVLGAVLLVSRIGHVLGMKNPKKYMILRQLGMVGTFSVILVASISLIWWYIPISI